MACFCLHVILLPPDIAKKFQEERKTRQLAEERLLAAEKQLQMLGVDLRFAREDAAKRERELADEVARLASGKRELETELGRRASELSSLGAELSSLRIKEKHLGNMAAEAKQESHALKDECDKLRKLSLEAENSKLKKLHDEIDDLKTLNQLYRSQRLESDDEIAGLTRDNEKTRADLAQLRRDM